ncbi:hypothetical protein BU26DRAFT_519151 [Trematosphaeria pertusa]|uniref:Uncharacterized protein n=1 Tax=Trematosphaeria pertusa TaxID=390896 RepID=A0A6A6IF07_9PLEO|nr:uncharacterized protein BU26DRAFT_519151 [Trematosphaeria pertusa]KAF2248986.1 hypothetical protein BU26DRAFT_519151 [Trematosphaeria pertusa]
MANCQCRALIRSSIINRTAELETVSGNALEDPEMRDLHMSSNYSYVVKSGPGRSSQSRYKPWNDFSGLQVWTRTRGLHPSKRHVGPVIVGPLPQLHILQLVFLSTEAYAQPLSDEHGGSLGSTNTRNEYESTLIGIDLPGEGYQVRLVKATITGELDVDPPDAEGPGLRGDLLGMKEALLRRGGGRR